MPELNVRRLVVFLQGCIIDWALIQLDGIHKCYDFKQFLYIQEYLFKESHIVYGSNCWSRAYILTLFPIDKDGAGFDRNGLMNWF
ncbi:hypothetical protein P8452_57213 [Trifolium repens]|nr:hypothetical protein P8452_57213 [Trifolium repens]